MKKHKLSKLPRIFAEECYEDFMQDEVSIICRRFLNFLEMNGYTVIEDESTTDITTAVG